MRNKFLTKVAAVVMMSAAVLSSASNVEAKTISTPFGTMRYQLRAVGAPSSKQKGAMAETKMSANSKRFSYVKTTLQVQKNATGVKIHEGSCTCKYQEKEAIGCEVESRLYRVDRLAAFSCHEVVGNGTKEAYEKLVY